MGRRKKEENELLYDIERDGVLQEGEAILIYEDGTRQKIKLPKSGEVGNATNQTGRRPITQRSRVSTRTERAEGNPRRTAAGKRTSLPSPDHKRQGIPVKRNPEVVRDAGQGNIAL